MGPPRTEERRRRWGTNPATTTHHLRAVDRDDDKQQPTASPAQEQRAELARVIHAAEHHGSDCAGQCVFTAARVLEALAAPLGRCL